MRPWLTAAGIKSALLADGITQSFTFTGGSVLYNYIGEPIEQASNTELCVITPELTRC